MRIFFAIVLALLVAAGLVLALQQDFTTGLVASPAALPAVAAAPYFDAVGTIDYYPNNVGASIPYLVYKDSSGATATKALAFDDASECITSDGNYPCALVGDALDSYYGAGPVRIVGTVDDENVIVDSISAP